MCEWTTLSTFSLTVYGTPCCTYCCSCCFESDRHLLSYCGVSPRCRWDARNKLIRFSEQKQRYARSVCRRNQMCAQKSASHCDENYQRAKQMWTLWGKQRFLCTCTSVMFFLYIVCSLCVSVCQQKHEEKTVVHLKKFFNHFVVNVQSFWLHIRTKASSLCRPYNGSSSSYNYAASETTIASYPSKCKFDLPSWISMPAHSRFLTSFSAAPGIKRV